ncbi:bifunctional diaminohydroxyphosphoribosylaminopyrimidine deaminase/5-amino-6-(5-phosphoribosylamino)uracil reductase RibD [Capnocytophaga canimorsus]|uniref:Riboflavin biosynthesis protein RibD n=1 Tax=Capnocytophaga canimorsus TaxID=28188 RepID=A0A0B7I885_9FLAO|nr:bifunctional diaminohydroxyphosphoribosylaminopyrimidine deaminase/5-amino-6-(5-phosphoribosylamino)uracil reductase RibD [Capnocytophaga canimorsus]CEN47935.1 Riboflavin biosynthesis protein RibD [Capnocytophaga canimorsus]
MATHEFFMQRCIQLAKNGLGSTYPNPLVGSVIVYQGKIIGEGWHKKSGEAHAEVCAINAVKDKSLLAESTIYVNLEPCSHYGKTPPCADLIVEKGIKRVVIGSVDPFSEVAGKGIEKLQNSGIQTLVGVLNKESLALNKRFFTFHNLKRPYIILKWAETQDGFIAPQQRQSTSPQWITNSYSRQWVHRLRSVEQSILIGTQTALDDNPKLDSRDWAGTSPLRIIIDRELKIPRNFSVWNEQIPTLFLSEKEQKNTQNTEIVRIDFSKNLPKQVCDLLYQKNKQSLIVEGGMHVIQQFIDADLWDEAWVFTGDNHFVLGKKAPTLYTKTFEKRLQIENDSLVIYKNPKL